MEAGGKAWAARSWERQQGHPWSLCGKPGLASTLISHFWPQNFETIAFCSFKSPVLWCFVGGVAPGDYRTPFPRCALHTRGSPAFGGTLEVTELFPERGHVRPGG